MKKFRTVSTALTEEEYELFLKAISDLKTSTSKFIRQAIKNELERQGYLTKKIKLKIKK
jgi:hypothetical protein